METRLKYNKYDISKLLACMTFLNCFDRNFFILDCFIFLYYILGSMATESAIIKEAANRLSQKGENPKSKSLREAAVQQKSIGRSFGNVKIAQ